MTRSRIGRLSRVVTAIVAACLLFLVGLPAASAAPGPPDAPEWWVDSWQVHSLWAAGADGRGITIGEIDSGVNASLPELAGKVLPGTDFGTLGGNGQTDRELDPFGHGTAMASIMVAASGIFGIEGLAPAAKLLPIAIPLTGTQDATGNDHLAQAIKYAADNGAKIINMSLGADRDQPSDPLACPADEQSAIFYALAKGDILIAAAGNNGPTDNDVDEPSVCIGVVTVGAIDSTGTAASFSSRSPNMTVTAPGVNIPSLGRIAGQAYDGKGTSQAAALTSAALALIWSKYPTLTGRQVLARLLATVDRPHSPADPAYGYGQINPASAINRVVPADAANPVFAAADPFLAQIAAQAQPKPTPPPAIKPASAPAGQYAAGRPPSQVTAEVRIAAAIAAAGLVCLLLLTAFGVRGRRSRRNLSTAESPSLGWATSIDPAMPWHDVFEPPAWAAPAEPPQWTAPPDQHSVVYPPAPPARPIPVPAEWSPPPAPPASAH